MNEQPFLGSCYLRGLVLRIKQFSGLDQSCWLFISFFFPSGFFLVGFFFAENPFSGPLCSSGQFLPGFPPRLLLGMWHRIQKREESQQKALPGLSSRTVQALSVDGFCSQTLSCSLPIWIRSTGLWPGEGTASPGAVRGAPAAHITAVLMTGCFPCSVVFAESPSYL